MCFGREVRFYVNTGNDRSRKNFYSDSRESCKRPEWLFFAILYEAEARLYEMKGFNARNGLFYEFVLVIDPSPLP